MVRFIRDLLAESLVQLEKPFVKLRNVFPFLLLLLFQLVHLLDHVPALIKVVTFRVFKVAFFELEIAWSLFSRLLYDWDAPLGVGVDQVKLDALVAINAEHVNGVGVYWEHIVLSFLDRPS